jgi:phosphoenolpyruvate-protein phosphotransferase (PTS system enzyme I)
MVSFNIHGVPVSNGIAIGMAHLISNALLEVVRIGIDSNNIKPEITRFKKSLRMVNGELKRIKSQLTIESNSQFIPFIDTHLMLLNDKSISEDPIRIIQKEKCNAEWAIKIILDTLVEKFNQIEDPYIRERKHDVVQVAERIIKALLGRQKQKTKYKNESSVILVAHDISPADALQFKNHKYGAFITEVGGANSHTAILARSLNIPSIVAAKNARKLIKNNDTIIVDGNQGIVIVNPTVLILNEYLSKQNLWEIEQKKLNKIRNIKCRNLGNETISLLANIEVPKDIKSVKYNNADGIGLFRTEFLFMNRPDLPNEEEQFKIYKSVTKSMGKLPVVIRTLDSGADKNITNNNNNLTSALGLRAIRLCLSEPHLFNTQLKAILRASAFGNIKILIPMLSSLQELRQTKMLIERAKQSLLNLNLKFNDKIQIGGMIEVPAVAINAEAFAKELDFLSIGTNDLVQYTLAIDRADDSVSHLYNSLHPAVLRLIDNTIKAGIKYNKEVSICGEMAGDPKLTKLLLGMGLKIFSMHPASLLVVKQQVLSSDPITIKKKANRILRSSEPDNIEKLLQDINKYEESKN